jgi:hypothetical protein
MTQHTTHTKAADTLTRRKNSGPNFLDAAAHRAAAERAVYSDRSAYETALARWENEGGAVKPPPHVARRLLLATQAALSGEATCDLLQRSSGKPAVELPHFKTHSVLTTRKGPASRLEERGTLGVSRKNAPTHTAGRQRGRRTIGRHGNHP